MFTAFFLLLPKRCKHYFCEKCALEAYAKNSKCPVCGQPTGGAFSVAKELIAKLKARNLEQSQEAQEAQASEPESSGDEE